MSTTPLSSPRPPQRVSLCSLAAQSLREAMKSGHWQGHLPGERELCAELQVSRQTLRGALSMLKEEGLLSVASRQRWQILAVPQQPSADVHGRIVAAISPRPLESMSHAAVIMVDQLRADLARAGFDLVIHVSSACFSSQPARALDALLRRSPAAVWVLFGSLEPMQRWFLKQSVPCIVVGSCVQDIPLSSVDINYRAACRHAGALLRRKGHKQIAFVRPEGDFGGDKESEEGLREALSDPTLPALQILRHNGTPPHLCALLDKVARQPIPPTAFVVARATHALTVTTHFTRAGRRIPKDIAIISRDDDVFLQHSVPAVTRYASSPMLFARKLSHAVRQMAEGGGLAKHPVRLMPKLLPGETV